MTTAQQTKQQERQARRRHIQQAAREVFAERGYTKASIEQMARRASLSVGAIYLYFRSKEELYISLLEETFARFDHDFTRMRGHSDVKNDVTTDATADLAAAWHYLVGWAQESGEGPRMLNLLSQQGVRKQLSDEVAERAASGLRQLRDHLCALARKGMDTGMYRGDMDAGRVADALWSLFLGTLQRVDTQCNLGIEGPSFAEAAHASFELFENSLRAQPARVAEAA